MSNLPPPPPPMSPPPGYVAYGGPGSYGGTYDRIRSLSKWVVVLTVASAAISMLGVIAQLALRDRAIDLIDEDASASEIASRLGPIVLAGLLTAAVGVGSLVVTILWTYRMANNHKRLGRTPQSFSPGATIAVNILGGCTLGILNFFMWRELWKASDPQLPPGAQEWRQRALSPLLIGFFVLSLTSIAGSIAVGVGNGFASIGRSNQRLAESLANRIGITVLFGLLSVVGSVLFAMFARRLSNDHMGLTGETAA